MKRKNVLPQQKNVKMLNSKKQVGKYSNTMESKI